MDIRSLQLFLHLAATLHFGKTAEAMHVSTSTLTRTMQRLEEAVGSQIFARDNRSVALTESGKRLQSFAQQTLENWTQLKADLNNHSGELDGELTIFCSVTAAYSHLPPILDKFRLLHPNVELKLITGDAAMGMQLVDEEKIDIAIAAHPDQISNRLKFVEIAKVPLSIITPVISCQVQQQIMQDNINWNAVPFILPEHGPARKRIDKWFKQMKIKPSIYATVAGHEAIVSMVALGLGVGIAPAVVVDNSPVRDRVLTFENSNTIDPFDLGLCCQRKRFDEPSIEAFFSMINH
ncbi:MULTISPECIES: HTH-type transcriptional activator IlvY [unclassified Moritella]|uniref:HTH-type transcriptional activator IlvY n=1 Tax=unclassified Moritella TaxID=2637987 RepID=UPI001BA6501B|nr:MULTISPECIES: HTH-type transcriptional activator IlvY [unclassified Moritella]QUM83085.1 HTH-type transcriptional activator IlvY [Moritella sp. 28]QUM87386.1 HTH-type transcriptional activator IlvY [Moritella sp. 36]